MNWLPGKRSVYGARLRSRNGRCHVRIPPLPAVFQRWEAGDERIAKRQINSPLSIQYAGNAQNQHNTALLVLPLWLAAREISAKPPGPRRVPPDPQLRRPERRQRRNKIRCARTSPKHAKRPPRRLRSPPPAGDQCRSFFFFAPSCSPPEQH